jgi:uncharacterized protein (TIGR02145 family)
MGIRLTTSFRNVLNKLYQVDVHDNQFIGSFEVKYGLLYNWYAATDARLICADGWHIPTRAEWESLATYIGADPSLKIIEPSLLYWDNIDVNTNEFSLNMRGSGQRTTTFMYLKTVSQTWTSTNGLYGPTSKYFLQLVSQPTHTFSFFSDSNNFWRGYGIRSVKDSTILTHGQTGTYTGNDGKVYRTICIGTQEWLADNLCETKYRNGDDIPEVTDNATWAALTAGALCAYDNDWSNAFTLTTGPATEYISGKSGFNLSYQTAGDDYLTTPIIGSSVELPIHLRDDNRTVIEAFLQDLISSDEDRFMVLIYENGSIYWRGKIQVERVQIPDRFYTEISIFAADGLGRLDSIIYSNGIIFYYDYETLQGHLHNIISKLELYQLGVEQELGIVQDWTVADIDGRFPESIQIHHDAFKEIKGEETLPISCLDVLKQLLYRFQLRIIQQDGIFFIEQIGYLTGTGNKTCHYYNSDGTFDSTTSGTTFNTAVTQKLAGGLSFYREPARYVQVQYAYKNGVSSNIFSGGPLAYNTPFVDGLIPNENSEVLGISFDFILQNYPPVDYTPNTFYFVQFMFTVQIGTYYLGNNNGAYGWSTDNTNRVILYSRQIDVNETGQFLQAIGFVAPVCPVADIFTFTWNTESVDLDYVTYPAANVDVQIARQDAQIIYGFNEPNEGTNSTTASSGNKSGEKIELPVLVTGDKPYGASIGRIQKYDGSDWINTFENWGFNADESLNIDELLSRETMALQKTSVVMQSLILRSDVNVANKIEENIIMTASYVANQNQWSLECFTPVIDRTGITFAYYTETDGTTIQTTQPLQAQPESAWIQSGGIIKPKNGTLKIDQVAGLLIVDADLTLDSTHYSILADTSTGAVDVTIPDASANPNRVYKIRKWVGANDLTITPTGYNSIIGSSASYALVTVTVNGEWIEIISDGTDWYVISDNPTI